MTAYVHVHMACNARLVTVTPDSATRLLQDCPWGMTATISCHHLFACAAGGQGSNFINAACHKLVFDYMHVQEIILQCLDSKCSAGTEPETDAECWPASPEEKEARSAGRILSHRDDTDLEM